MSILSNAFTCLSSSVFARSVFSILISLAKPVDEVLYIYPVTYLNTYSGLHDYAYSNTDLFAITVRLFSSCINASSLLPNLNF